MLTNVLEYLEHAAKAYPEKIVFEDMEKTISYEQCEKTARKIGSLLAQKKERRKPVAVLIDRDVESMISFLGCVYSGNFYVPISKHLPMERISLILKTVQPICMICRKEDGEFAGVFRKQTEVLFYEDFSDAEIDEPLLADVRKKHVNTDPLYAIFTSGSTGVPKGVLISHQSVMNMAEQFTEAFGFDEHEVFGNQAPFDFDVSVKDIYNTLKNGATLCVLPQKMFSFPRLLVACLEEKRVTTVIWAVSALAMVSAMNGLKTQIPSSLKKIMFSGEVMPISVFHYWKERIPDALYVNLYGPTEITCNCTYYVVDRDFALSERMPIGNAFENTEVFLLNDRNELAEEGEIGEICVRGCCLALGYYGAREATENAFCQNPLQSMYPERIYRTGDLGRYEKGELYYINRKDAQIKHMGHRIELGEIEACLNGLEYLSRSCCMYNEKKQKIVLFYQADAACEAWIAMDLQRKLPKYMCPNQYVFLEQLPLNKNGKIDRQRLKNIYFENSNGGKAE